MGDVSPEELTAGFIVIDPAYGEKAIHDDAALTVHGRKQGLGVPFVCDMTIAKMSEVKLFDSMLELVYKWGLTTIVIEATAAQRLYLPLFRAFMREREIALESLTFLPLFGQTQKDAKSTRIAAFRRIIQDESYFICDNCIDLKLALEEWSHENPAHDDGPDSASMGPIVWAAQGDIIESAGGHQARIGEILHGAEVGAVMHGRSEFETALI
jgi:hypothetical protein